MVWRFVSPRLEEADKILRECPVGAVLRETPWVYEAMAAESFVEAGAVNPLLQTPWLQAAMQVVAAERNRLREYERQQSQSAGDAAFGSAVLKGRV